MVLRTSNKNLAAKHGSVSDNAMSIFKKTLEKLSEGNEDIEGDIENINTQNAKLQEKVNQNVAIQNELVAIKTKNAKFAAKINEFFNI